MIDDDWSSSRLETTYREARTVLDAQNDTIADVDDKAMRTVRVTVVVVGIVASTIELAGGSWNWVWVTTASIAYLGALAVGILTYSESELYLGPRRTYVEQLRRNRFEERPWQQDLLATYGEWIEQNRKEVQRAGQLLLAAQTLLIAGVIFTVFAVVF